jgi:hypothetical protein
MICRMRAQIGMHAHVVAGYGVVGVFHGRENPAGLIE